MSEQTAPKEVGRARISALPKEMVNAAARRVGWVALLYSATFFFAYFGTQIVAAMTGIATIVELVARPVQFVVATVSMLAGVAVFLISRRGVLPPGRVLDLGSWFWVLGALGIGTAEFWGSRLDFDPAGYTGLSWVGVWILLFPVAAPSTPRRTLVVGLLAASMPLLVFWTASAVGATRWEGLSYGEAAIYFLFTTYLCAAMAYFVSHVIHGFGRQIREARAIGNYRLIERLGVGGMGEVWRAQHRLLAKPAAVKLIRPEVLEGGFGLPLERFEREAQATALLRSVHTIELYDFGAADDGSFFYVMELLDGLSLEQLVERHGPQSPGRTIHLLRQVCRSLDEAHASGLVHRDIKPGNVFVCCLGADVDFVKVLDFGLVKGPDRVELGDSDLTGHTFVAGTPAYAAPEMTQREEVDGRADLYSLGCVGYWLLTGTPVFRSKTPLSLIVDHVKEPPEPPSSRLEGGVPADLEAVVMRCLEKSPPARYASAAELDHALARCAASTDWLQSDAFAWWNAYEPSVRPATQHRGA